MSIIASREMVPKLYNNKYVLLSSINLVSLANNPINWKIKYKVNRIKIIENFLIFLDIIKKINNTREAILIKIAPIDLDPFKKWKKLFEIRFISSGRALIENHMVAHEIKIKVNRRNCLLIFFIIN